MRPQTIFRSLSRKLSEEQLIKIGSEMADVINKIEEIEVAKKRVTPLREELTLLGSKYANGAEVVEMECTVHYNTPEAGKKTIIRPDTGETVEVVDISKDDLQEDLEFSDADVVDETKQLEGHNDLAIPENPRNAA